MTRIKTHLVNPAARRRSVRLLSMSVLLVIVFCSVAMLAAASGVRRGVSAMHRSIPHTGVACLQANTSASFEVKPRNCVFKGFKGRNFDEPVSVPVGNSAWEGWGLFRSRTTAGVNTRTGHDLRIYLYRRIRCPDRRVFYSRANFVDATNDKYFSVRLAICNELGAR